jgi:surface antigen
MIHRRSRRRAGLTRHLATLLALGTALAALALAPLTSDAAVGTDDYPSNLKNAAQDSVVDPWLFYNRECTSFVAWRLNHDAGVDFHNYYLGVHWGNASNWKYAASQVGVRVDSTPHLGALAWWAKGSPGSSRGHVAWVKGVTSSSITIEEYNYLSAGRYDQRTIYSDSSMWPSAFIHVGDLTMRNGTRPSTSGTPKVGVKLTASPGTWTPSGATYSYQWLADGVAITGATYRSYTPRAAQLGERLRVQVTASLVGAEPGTATSPRTAAVAPGDLVVTAPPTITGTPRVDSQLSATNGTWSPTADYTYRWNAGGTPVAGATKPTFSPTAEQLGKPISVTVTATRAGYTTASSTSPATTAVAPATFATTAPPSISGTPQVDQPLVASLGDWSPTGTPSYQWLVAGTPVPGATGSTYTPGADDLRKQVTVNVTMTRPGYTTASSASAATDPVLPGTFRNSSDPTISGTARVGLPLTADPGGWSPEPTFGYQWYADGTAIAGATTATFTPTAAQLGKQLTVEVTARRPGYLTALVESSPTAQVAPGTITSVSRPAISGSPVVGGTVSASSGTWSVTPSEVAYQWYADSNPISGATAASYSPTTAVLDRRLTVRVTVSADGYDPASATSAPSSPVVLGNAQFTSTPTLSGTAVLDQLLTAHPGTHTPSTATVSYQWLRAGVPIAGATGSAHRLVAADVGDRVAVQITLTAPHWASATTRVGTVTVVKSVPQLGVRDSVNGHWVVLRFSVVAPGITGPDGNVIVTEGDAKVGKALVTDGHGRLGFGHVPSGLHHYLLTYGGPLQTTVTRRLDVTVP